MEVPCRHSLYFLVGSWQTSLGAWIWVLLTSGLSYSFLRKFWNCWHVFVSVQSFVTGWWVVCEQCVHVVTSCRKDHVHQWVRLERPQGWSHNNCPPLLLGCFWCLHTCSENWLHKLDRETICIGTPSWDPKLRAFLIYFPASLDDSVKCKGKGRFIFFPQKAQHNIWRTLEERHWYVIPFCYLPANKMPQMMYRMVVLCFLQKSQTVPYFLARYL